MDVLLFLNILWQISSLALVTFGLAVVFGRLRIMNLAHGEFIMIGAYTSVMTASLGLPAVFELPVCILVAVLVAISTEYLIIRHFYGKVFQSLLATWALGILMREAVIVLFGRSYQSVELPIEGVTSLMGTDYPTYRLVLMVGIVVFFLIFGLWYHRSRTGTKVEAMVHNPVLAMASGINTRRLSQVTFVFGVVLASISGWLLAPTARVDPFMGLDYLIRSFFALVVGGMGSIYGIFVGSSVVGGLQTFVSSIFEQITGYTLVLIIVIMFLWKRPHGIVSSR